MSSASADTFFRICPLRMLRLQHVGRGAACATGAAHPWLVAALDEAASKARVRIYLLAYFVYADGMRTVIDLDEDLLERARRELGTATKKDTIHEALRLVAERGARLEAIQELLSIDRDWTGIVDEDKVPKSERNVA